MIVENYELKVNNGERYNKGKEYNEDGKIKFEGIYHNKQIKNLFYVMNIF